MNNDKFKNVLDQITLSDTTQREGRQSKDVHIPYDHSIQYAQLVNCIGIDYIELNHPASSSMFAKLVNEISNLNLKTKVTTHVRLNLRDIQTAIKAGAKAINTYIPTNPSSTLEQITSVKKAVAELDRITNLTLKDGIELRVSIEHAFSMPVNALAEAYQMIAHISGVHRVGMAETTGICLPQKLREYALAVYSVIPNSIPIQFHLHNDHGLVAANFLEILNLISENGRKAMFDISFDGIGERNGILSYGDVFSVLYIIDKEKLSSRYRISNYALFANFVSKNLGIDCSRRDPLNKLAFCHSSAPHLQGVMNGSVYQAIEPEDFGFKTELNIGHCVTGYKGIQYFAKTKMNIQIPDDLAKYIASFIREKSSFEGPIKDPILKAIIYESINSRNLAA